MTVQTTTLRADYTGNGSTTAFTVPFYFLDNSHLAVYRTQISTGVITTLAITTDYTVTGAGVGTGGEITCLVAPTADQKISILRDVPFTQLTHYVENDPFPAASHERALDQLTMSMQQLQEEVDRAAKLPVNNTTDAQALVAAILLVADDITNVDAVATDIANVNAVAGDLTNIDAVKNNATNINAVNANKTNIDAVAGNATNINAVNSNKTNIDTVAAANSNISTVATNVSAVNTNATNITAITTNATNITAIQGASANASAAQAAQAAAETARDQTLAVYDSFDDRYLGAKTSDPTVDNDGNPLVAGAIYFNSVSGVMRLYTGSAWVAAYVQGVASGIGFTPAGGIAATNVQAAIEEVDTEAAKLANVQSFTKAQRGTPVALTSSSNSIATDASLGNYFTHTFTENTTLANPSNLAAGQSGVIVLTQHASSPKTLAFGSYWKFSSGTVPSVTASNSAVDVLAYYVESTTRITAKLITDVK